MDHLIENLTPIVFSLGIPPEGLEPSFSPWKREVVTTGP